MTWGDYVGDLFDNDDQPRFDRPFAKAEQAPTPPRPPFGVDPVAAVMTRILNLRALQHYLEAHYAAWRGAQTQTKSGNFIAGKLAEVTGHLETVARELAILYGKEKP